MATTRALAFSNGAFAQQLEADTLEVGTGISSTGTNAAINVAATGSGAINLGGGAGPTGLVNVGTGINYGAVAISRTGVNTTVNGAFIVSGQGTLNGNVDATAGLDVTGAVLSCASGFTQSAGATSLTGTTFTGAYSGVVTLDHTGLVFNEAGADVDTRFEADADTNLLYLDAGLLVGGTAGYGGVGIGTVPTHRFHIHTTAAAAASGLLFGISNPSNAYALRVFNNSASQPQLAVERANGGTDFIFNTDGACSFGVAAVARTITIGNVTGTTSLVVNTGTGASSWTMTGAGTFSLVAGTGAIGLANNATDHATTVGSTTTASPLTLQAGTGAWTATAGGIFDVNATDAVTIDSTAGTIGIGTGADAFAMNFGTGAAARTLTFGNVTGATAVVVNAGTGVSSWTVTGVGTLSLIAGTGTVSLAANATDHGTVLGSVTGVSALVLQSGTGDITAAVGAVVSLVVDDAAVAESFAMQVYDVTGAALKRFVRGGIDSAGAGFRLVRVAN